MICPDCGANIEKKHIHNKEIDLCPGCHGMLCPTNSIGLYLRLLAESDHDYKPKTAPLKVENVKSGEQGWICNAPSQAKPRDMSTVDEAGMPSQMGRPQPEPRQISNKTVANSRDDSDASPDISTLKTHSCPVCRQEMTEMQYAPDSDIALAECKNCHMVWMSADTICTMFDYLSIPTTTNVDNKAKTSPNTFDRSRIAQDGVLNVHTSSRTHAIDAASEIYFKNSKPAYEDTIEIPIIRRILGIPCVERDLSIMPWATISIIAVNVILFLIVAASPNDMGTLFRNLGFIPARLSHEPIAATFSFFTSMFMHSGFSHLFSNMVFLWLFGGRIEEDYGTKTFVAVYMIAGIIAGLSHALTNLGSPIPAVGASGAISGILGAFFVLHPKNRVVTYFMLIPIPMSAAVFLGFWFSMQIINSLLASAAGGAGIAWFAHIGGFIAGMAMAYPLKKQVELIAQEQLKIAA
jgi:membrane associated rhomboid family serine protease/Zn-finger nucleic acid-binding protein